LSAAYPTRPIRLVVLSPPGGSTDLLARLAAQHLGDALGQLVVIDSAKRASVFSDLPTVAEAPLRAST
jgi:tripartite-type tricarboxylate transporter receptor subunit TctC